MIIGVAIAERSVLIACFAFIGIIVAMGLGFTLKKRARESSEI